MFSEEDEVQNYFKENNVNKFCAFKKNYLESRYIPLFFSQYFNLPEDLP